MTFNIPIAGWGFIGLYDIGATDWSFLQALYPAKDATSGTVTFTAPSVAGPYQVKFISLFSGTKVEATANVSVGAVVIPPPTPAPSPVPTPPPPGSPRNAKAAKILNYLINLPTQSSRRLISGQQIPSYHPQDHGLTSMWEIEGIRKKTGHYVGLMGTDGYVPAVDALPVAKDYAANGGLVSFYPAFRNPISGKSVFDNYIPDFNKLSTPGTAENNAYLAMLDTHTVPQLQYFKDAGVVLLFRPFPEVNGYWFWWGGRDTAQFVKLWQQTYIYLVYTKGFDNLLWVHAPDAGYPNLLEYYAGTDYVDIVGFDSYSMPLNVSSYQKLLTTGKPFALPEVNFSAQSDSYTNNWTDMINAIKTYLPKTVYFNVWYSYPDCGGHSLGLYCQMGPTPTTFLDDPWIVNRENLPPF